MILYLIKSAICSCLLLLFYHLVLEKESLYKFNRFYLLGAIIFSLLVPFMTNPFTDSILPVDTGVMLYGEQAPILLAELDTVTSSSETVHATVTIGSQQGTLKINWIFWIYVMVTVLLLGRFIWQIFNFGRLIQKNQVIDQGYYQIVLLDGKSQPFAFLNYLFVPKESYLNRTIESEIWEHELTHIKEIHTLDILLVELIRILFWFNPIFYFYKKAIQLNHEFLADSKVLKSPTNIVNYQNLLLRKSSGMNHLSELSSPLNYSMTKKRLIMMYRKTTLLKGALIRSALIPIVFLLTGIFGTRAGQDLDPSLDSLWSGSSPVDQYENYIIEALDVTKVNVVLLEKLDIKGIKRAYDQLSEEEKEQVSQFPFLDDKTTESLQLLQELNNPYRVEFRLTTPPSKKIITDAVWSAWHEVDHLEVWVDDEKISTQDLNDYSPTDFALYEIREDKKKGNYKGSAYSLMLTSHEYYHQKHVMARKNVEVIHAYYQKDNNISTPTVQQVYRIAQGELIIIHPGNWANDMIEELINPSLKEKKKEFISADKNKAIPATYTEGNKTTMVYVKMPN